MWVDKPGDYYILRVKHEMRGERGDGPRVGE